MTISKEAVEAAAHAYSNVKHPSGHLYAMERALAAAQPFLAPQPTQSDEEWAREALARGRMATWPGYTTETTWENTDQQNRDHWLSMIRDSDVRSVAAFAAAVRAEATLAEREACAKVAEDGPLTISPSIAAAIRARSTL